MTKESKKYPDCFSDLQKVFPLGNDGLRHTPEDCLAFLHKTECLRSAVKGKDGLRVKEEHLQRAYNSGTISFWERWSRKKDFYRRKKKRL